MPDVAELGVRVTLDGAQAAADGLDNVATSADKAEASTKRLIGTNDGLTASQRAVLAMTDEQRRLYEQFTGTTTQLGAAQAEVANTYTESRRIVLQHAQAIELTGSAYRDNRALVLAHAQALEVNSTAYRYNDAVIAAHVEALEMEAAAHATAGRAAGVHGLNLGRLNMELGTATGRILGMNTAATRFGAMLGGSLGGYTQMIAITAGLIALVEIYDHLTGKSKELEKAQEELTKSAEKWYDTERRGADGERARQLDAEIVKVNELAEAYRRQQAIAASPAHAAPAGAGLGVQYGAIGAEQTAKDLQHGNDVLLGLERDLTDKMVAEQVRRLTSLVANHQATVQDRQRLADDLTAIRSRIAHDQNISGQSATLGERADLVDLLKSGESALNPKSTGISRVGERTDDTVAKLTAETQSLLAENAARDKGVAALDAWRIANAGALAVADVENRQRDAANAAREKGITLTTVQVAAFAREKDAVRAAAEAHESAALAVQHHTEASHSIESLTAQAAAIRAETDALKAGGDTRETYTIQKVYDLEVTKALHEATFADTLAHLAAARAVRDAALAHVEVADAMKVEEEAAKKAASARAKLAAEQERVTKTMVEGIQHSFVSFFDDIMTKGTLSFRSLFDEIKAMFMKLIAEMAAADIMKSVIGKGIAAIAGGILGLPSAASAQTGGGSAIPDSAFGLGGSSTMKTIGAGVGIAGLGFGVGSMIGSHASNAVTGTLGGAAGGAAMGASIGMLGGPIGVAAGAFIGGVAGAVGGLLGFTHSASQAADAARKMQLGQDSIAASLAQWRAQITGTAADQKAAAQFALKVQYEQLVQTIESTEAGKKQEEQRNKDLAEAATLYADAQKKLTDSTLGLTDAMLNAVQGYKYQATIFGAAPAHAAPLTAPVTGNSGYTGGSGTTSGGGSGGDLTVHVVLPDGSALGTAVLKDFKRRAGSQFRDTTKWGQIQ